MRAPSAYALTAACLASVAVAQGTLADTKIVGTWSTKSNKTLTGPGFYDPVGDNLIEPSRTGISYSFTSDGFYEEAYYRAVSNPASPNCPSGIMQWQHGKYVIYSNGSVVCTPFAVDGRQLLSEPCSADESIYTRYNQTETFLSYEVLVDPYHNIQRLNLYEFDGTPMIPMYLVYSPPQMLPTITLNPTATVAGATTTSNAKSKKVRRALGLDREVPLNFKGADTVLRQSQKINPDRWWWVGLSMTGVGGLLYFGPRRMGIQL